MEPISFIPVYKDYVWGGNLLSSYRPLSSSGIYAESWELFDRKEGTSLVASGVFQGKTLRFLVETMGERLLGKGKKFARFPLILKIIDAKENLSIQVHPSSGSEAWFFLGEKPSFAYAGWRVPMSEERFRRELQEKRIEQAFKKHEVQKGDLLHVPGGVVHSIGGGGLLLEVQNNASTTFRLYDWERKNRPLHVEEAMQEILWEKEALFLQQPSLFRGPQFSISTFSFQGDYKEKISSASFLLLFFAEGEGKIATKDGEAFFRPFMSFLVAADSEELILQTEGSAKVVKISLLLEGN